MSLDLADPFFSPVLVFLLSIEETIWFETNCKSLQYNNTEIVMEQSIQMSNSACDKQGDKLNYKF